MSEVDIRHMASDRVKEVVLVTSLVAVLAALLVVMTGGVVQQQQEAYAQGAAFYSELDEDHQALISEVLNGLQNQTANDISIYEDGSMIITWIENVTATAPDGSVFEITRDSTLTVPHNFTAANGYQYRDGTIFKPDGTELFAD
jgi:sugar lactone lactonase YvrE